MGVVLIMLGLTLLAHALLLIADQELRASRAGAAALAVKLGARSAYRAGLRSAQVPPESTAEHAPWSLALPADSMALGVAPAAPIERSVGWTRLSQEVWLVEGRAASGVARRSIGRPVWLLDPAARVFATEGVLTLGDSTEAPPSDFVDASAVRRAPVIAPASSCAPALAALDSLGWVGVREIASRPEVEVIELGLLGFDTLLARAEARASGTGMPVPRFSGGVCTADAWNWGDPGGAWPCEEHIPVVRLADGTSVVDGLGQGVLLLEGSAELVGTRYYGVVVGAGPLTLRNGAHVTGLVRVQKGVRGDGEPAISGSACWAASTLSAGALRRPLEVPESGWIRGR